MMIVSIMEAVMRLLKYFLILLFSFAISSVSFSAPEDFTIDSSHTYVLFRISHFDFSNQTGKWYAKGTITLDKDKPANGKVNATIDVANIITGISELDKHLKSEEFFDVDKYPTATFTSTKVTPAGMSAKVAGNLTLRGVTKPVILNVKINKSGISPITKKMTIGFEATTQIKRSDFGMKAYLPGLGDNVEISISGEASK